MTFVRGKSVIEQFERCRSLNVQREDRARKNDKPRTGRIDNSSGIRGVRLSSTPRAMVPWPVAWNPCPVATRPGFLCS